MSEPECPQKAPYVIEEQARKVAWCRCGLSPNQPYCDGKHKATDIRPIVIELTEARRVAWCGCKQSGNKPFCDCSHKDL